MTALPGLELEPVYCSRCRRKLRTAESRRRGRGPGCEEKVNPRRGRDHSPRPSRSPRTPPAQPPAAADPTLFDPPAEDTS